MHSPESKSFNDLLRRASDQREAQKPFVLFKYPGESEIKGIFQNDARLFTTLDLKQSGFVFSPFTADMPAVVLRPDTVLTVPFPHGQTSSRGEALSGQNEAEAARYKKLVSLAIEYIRAGKMKKVVLSRFLEAPTKKSLPTIFVDLVRNYPSAFCYCWYHPGVGSWAGATPETLLHFSAGVLTTVALAGTLEKQGTEKPSWGRKENEEQQLVTDYIQERLQAQGVQTSRSEVETIGAGTLWHLRTTLSGRAAEEQVGPVLKALHPTPAVCGIPLQAARRFIIENEGYSRKYYTGFLGEIHGGSNGETRLFVNLRCMELLGSTARIFVGGGVTADSDPEKEWEETVAKSKTMARVL